MKKSHLVAWSFLLSFFSTFAQEKLRVLYIVKFYPQLSETYIHEEIASLWNNYEIKIISYKNPSLQAKQSFPSQLINYDENNEEKFISEMGKVIQQFKPHVLHTHWLTNAPLLEKLANRYNIYFSIRTHSFDVLAQSSTTLKKFCTAANSPWCLRVLCFPAFEQRLINHGLMKQKIVPCWPVINYKKFYQPEKRTSLKRIFNEGAALPKKDYHSYVDLATSMKDQGFEFNLYIIGYLIDRIRTYNKQRGNPVNFIGTVQPKEMPIVYRDHDWLIYTADTKINSVGLPIGIAEAQASGIGVCWQELPGRREEQLEFLGGAGFLFKSIDELPEILNKPYPEDMRLKGLENAKKCNIESHKHLLTEVWDTLFEKKN